MNKIIEVPELELLTITEVAEYLHVCPNTIRELSRKGVIKPIKMGKLIRILKQDLKYTMYDLARKGVRVSLDNVRVV